MAIAKTASLKKAMRSTWKSCLGCRAVCSAGKAFSFFCIIIDRVAIAGIKNLRCMQLYLFPGNGMVFVQLFIYQVGIAEQFIRGKATGTVHNAHILEGKC